MGVEITILVGTMTGTADMVAQEVQQALESTGHHATIQAMDELAATYGRKLRYAINPQVICCETQAEAERLADEAERNAGPRDRMVNALGAGLVGTPPLLAERLRRYEEVGIDIMMTRFTPMMEGMETFGTEVMPLLGREAAE